MTNTPHPLYCFAGFKRWAGHCLIFSSVLIQIALLSSAFAQDRPRPVTDSPAVNNAESRITLPLQEIPQNVYLSRKGAIVSRADLATRRTLKADEILTYTTGKAVERKPSVEVSLNNLNVSSVLALPDRYIAPLEGVMEAATLQPVLYEHQWLQYQETENLFKGEMLVLLEDPARPSVSSVLKDTIHIWFSSPAARVEPAVVKLTRTNMLSDPIKFSIAVPADSLLINVITVNEPRGITTYLPVESALTFGSFPREIQGWGVQRIPISVTVKGRTITAPVPISFEASAGYISPEMVLLRKGGVARTTLRSEGTGAVVVRASSPNFRDVELRLRYVFPYAFFVMALLGGAFGGIVAYLRSKAKSANTSWKSHVLGGTLWGLIAAGAYLGLGINVLGIHLPVINYFNELLVFVISALAGITWSLSIRTRRTGEPA